MMSTWNGIGTKYMGLVPAEEPGAHYATKWFVLFDLPIFPLRREKVIFGEIRGDSQTNQILEKVPLSLASVFRTWFLSWFVVVPLLFGPMALLVLNGNTWRVPFFMSKGWVIFGVVWFAAVMGYLWYGRGPEITV